MKPAKRRYDKSTPEARALRDEIVHGTFVKEGTMVAFPMCFPGASVPITADESHITALAVDHAGTVYGGTSGRATHLFVGMFHGVAGMVLDMGTVQGANHCTAICCGREKFVACVNGPAGGRVVTRALEPLPFDLIQEWGFSRTPFEDLGSPVPGERILHAVVDQTRAVVTGVTDSHLFVVDIEAGELNVVAEVPGRGRLAVGSEGGIFGLDDGAALWHYHVSAGVLERNVAPLPQGTSWDEAAIRWARDPHSGVLYVADDAGHLFAFAEEDGFRGPLGKTPLAPAGPMVVTLDGRVFGTCGEGVSRLFSYHPGRQEVRDLGAAVSVIERRRYGDMFGDAVMGRDGEIVFGEDDDLGHVWVYFPRVEAP